jgi:ABC-type Mn2+/Zn2+ transport system permease subunit
MLEKIPHSAPGVDPTILVTSGATELRQSFTLAQLPGVLVAYMAGLNTVFALVIAGTGVALLLSLGNKWKRLNTEAIKNGGPSA